MPSIEERVRALEVVAEENRRRIMELHADIHSGPGVEWKRSVRGQLHAVRDAQITADRLAEAAREVRKTAEQQSRSRLSFVQWLVLALIAAAALIPPYALLLTR